MSYFKDRGKIVLILGFLMATEKEEITFYVKSLRKLLKKSRRCLAYC